MIRLYFNQKGELPWSVDSGPGTSEWKFSSVAVWIEGFTVHQWLKDGEDPQEVPQAWIQFDGASVEHAGNQRGIIKHG